MFVPVRDREPDSLGERRPHQMPHPGRGGQRADDRRRNPPDNSGFAIPDILANAGGVTVFFFA
jgi:hypothetical protein